MISRKSIAAALVLLMLVQISCAGQSQPSEVISTESTISETSEAETTRLYYDTSGIDYEGYEFRIWNYDNELDNGWTGIPDDIYVESESGDILSDAVYKRNQVVNETLGVEIISDKVGDGQFASRLKSTVMAGDQEVDLVFPRQFTLPSFVQSELLCDLMTLDSFDFSEPWWNQNFIDALTLQNQLYGVVSDATYFDKLATYVTFYSKQLADDYKLGNLYELVKNDEWTLDKLLELGAGLSADLNNDGKRDDTDSYPLSCQNDGCYILLHAGRIPIATKTADGSVSFNLPSEKAVNALQTIYELMGDDTQYFNRQKYTDYTLNDAIAMFNEGRAMFLIRPIQSLFVMRSMDSDFGILPLPKLTADQEEYGSAINLYTATVAAIPLSVSDPERTATVLSLMACESYYNVNPALYETVLGEKLIRDEDSAEMLDITFNSAMYDTGLIWNFGNITTTLLANTSADIASLLAEVTPQVETAIDKLNELLAEKK